MSTPSLPPSNDVGNGNARKYYFTFSDQVDTPVEFGDGIEFPDDASARAAADKGAREILCERLKAGEQFGHETIAVDDAQGNRLFVVSFDEIIAAGLSDSRG